MKYIQSDIKKMAMQRLQIMPILGCIAVGNLAIAQQTSNGFTGYSPEGALYMGGQRIGNPHQQLHDMQNPLLWNISATAVSNTTTANYIQGTLSQIEPALAVDPGGSSMSRLYLSTTNPYAALNTPSTAANPNGANNYATYAIMLQQANTTGYSPTLNTPYIAKNGINTSASLSGYGFHEFPISPVFLAAKDTNGGAVAVFMSQSGQAARHLGALAGGNTFVNQNRINAWTGGVQKDFYVVSKDDPNKWLNLSTGEGTGGFDGSSSNSSLNQSMISMWGNTPSQFGFTGELAERRYSELMREFASTQSPYYTQGSTDSSDGFQNKFNLTEYKQRFQSMYVDKMRCEINSDCYRPKGWVGWRDEFVIPAAAMVAGAFTGAWVGGVYEAAAATTILEGGTAFTIAGGINGTTAIVGGASGGFASSYIGSRGDFYEGMRGALVGGLSAGVMNGYGDTYDFGRVATQTAMGCIGAILTDGSCARGAGAALVLSGLSYANYQMRNEMIAQSRIDLRNDGTGLSNGMYGDGFKLGGGRFDETDPSGTSPLGGRQNGTGSILGTSYTSGGLVDLTVEAFAGPHDYFNAPWYYDPTSGNIRAGTDGFMREFATNYSSSLLLAAPFAFAGILDQTNNIGSAAFFNSRNRDEQKP
jgi:hypothetical protein